MGAALYELMLEAKAAGAVELTFNVNLGAYEGIVMDDALPRWAVRAMIHGDLSELPHVAVGCTAEDALLELVVFLEKMGEKNGES